MQKLNPKETYSYERIQEMILNLVNAKIITEEEANVINISKILNFTKTEIWEEMKIAKEIHKEKPFYMNVCAKAVIETDTDESILVQGIVDLYYINNEDNIVLVDYKTDFVDEGDESALVRKYRKQLDVYKNALEDALGKKVEKMYIYSTYLDKHIDVLAAIVVYFDNPISLQNRKWTDKPSIFL